MDTHQVPRIDTINIDRIKFPLYADDMLFIPNGRIPEVPDVHIVIIVLEHGPDVARVFTVVVEDNISIRRTGGVDKFIESRPVELHLFQVNALVLKEVDSPFKPLGGQF